MSLIISNLNYSGKLVNEVITEAFAETLFHKNFGARIIAGMKSKYVWFDLQAGGCLEAYEVCPSSFGDIDLNQRSGELCSFQWLKEIDKNSLVGTAREVFLSQGFNVESPTDDTLFTDALLNSALQHISNQWDNLILNGDTMYGAECLDICDGFRVKWEADTNVVDVTTVPANITPSAVIGELNKVYNAVPKALKFHSDPNYRVKIGAAINVVDAYVQYLTQQGNGFNFFDPTQAGTLKYLGLDIVPLNWLPDDEIFATYPSNLALFYDGDGDFSEIRTWDLSESRPCDKIQMRVKFRGAVDYGYGKDIVWGRP